MKKKMLSLFGTAALTAVLAVPLVAADQKAATSIAPPAAWPAESLAGTIVSVDPGKRIVVVKDSSGVPFDLVVSRSTRIEAGGREVELRNLNVDVNKNASIRFVPERTGDIARSILIRG